MYVCMYIKVNIIYIINTKQAYENYQLWLYFMFTDYIYLPFSVRDPRSGAGDENSTALCILPVPPAVVL